MDFQYPSEGIHKRWDAGYRITACAATPEQAAFVLSIPRRTMADETQETLRTSTFPSGGWCSVHLCSRPGSQAGSTVATGAACLGSCSALCLTGCGPKQQLYLNSVPSSSSAQWLLSCSVQWLPAFKATHPKQQQQHTLAPSCLAQSSGCLPAAEHVKEKWAKDLYIAGITYGRTVT